MEKKLIQFKKRDMFLREQEEDDIDVKLTDEYFFTIITLKR